MNQKTGSPPGGRPKAHPLFIKLFLTVDEEEDREDERRAGRRGARLRDAVAGDVRQAAELLETGLADGGCRTRVLCQTLRRSAENLS